jgi:Trehalose utilisation
MSDRRRRALVMRGGWDRHAPVEATEVFIPFLEQAGFELRVETSIDAYTDADAMSQTDLVVQCWTMGEITEMQLTGLATAVEDGTGSGSIRKVVDSQRDGVQTPIWRLLTLGLSCCAPERATGLVRASAATRESAPTSHGAETSGPYRWPFWRVLARCGRVREPFGLAGPVRAATRQGRRA